MPDADGRRADGCRRRARGRGVRRGGSSAASTWPSTTSTSRARARRSCSGRSCDGTRPGRRSPARLQRRPSQPDPRAAAAEVRSRRTSRRYPCRHPPSRAFPDLMHHKFAVRDGTAVLTGSTNWTDDSWTRQENVMLTVESPALGEAYALAFEAALVGTAGDRGGPGRAAPRRRRRHRCTAVVLPRVRRRAFPPGGEGDRAGEAPRSHLLAGHLGRAGAGDARAGRGRGPRGRRRLRGCDAARVRAPAVDGEEGVGLEDPAARDDPRARAVLGQELDAVGARAASTTSCTRR